MDQARSGAPATLRSRGTEWLTVWGVCLGLALAYSVGAKLRRTLHGEPVDWSALPTEHLLHFGTWALLYPCVALLTAAFPLGDRRRRSIPVHAVAALLFSPLLMTLTFGLNGLARRESFSWAGLFRDSIVPEFAWGVTAYVVFLSVAHATEFRRRERARALGEARLEGALALARLNALRMQLEPHFLFNALNSVSSLLRRDPDGAERMIARLGDFLRLTLDDSMPQKVELRQELEFLERYLDIERVRFRDRLSVAFEVPPELLDARVPYLLLQPLVENAIRHGVAECAGAGSVVVRATLRERRLCLDVEDDGAGFSASVGPPTFGVGLANVRERLAQLYGNSGQLSLGPRGDRGTCATVELPWERGAAADGAMGTP